MNTDHEFDMLEIGSDFREAGIAAHTIQITFGKCTTKEQYTKLANELKDVIVSFGWQNDVKKHYAEWKRKNGY